MIIRVIEKVLHDVRLSNNPDGTNFFQIQLQPSAPSIKLLLRQSAAIISFSVATPYSIFF